MQERTATRTITTAPRRAARPGWFWPLIVAFAALPIATAAILYMGSRDPHSSAATPPASPAVAALAPASPTPAPGAAEPEATRPEATKPEEAEPEAPAPEKAPTPDTTPPPEAPAPEAPAPPVTAPAPTPASPTVEPTPRPSARPVETAETTATAKASGNGELAVRARPWALVAVDGRAMGTTPRVLQLAAGRHRVTLTRGSDTHSRWVTVAAGKSVVIEHDFGR